MENFELPGYTLIKSNTNPTDTNWKFASAAESFEGKSVEIGLTGNALVAQVESSISYTLPSGSSNVFLEINYKANQAFEVGMVSGLVNKPAVMVNPSETWNKIYIQLAEIKKEIVNIKNVNFGLNGTYPVTVKGVIEIHGIKKEITANGKFKIDHGSISCSSEFIVNMGDFGIVIPGVVSDKLSKTAKININCNFALLK